MEWPENSPFFLPQALKGVIKAEIEFEVHANGKAVPTKNWKIFENTSNTEIRYLLSFFVSLNTYFLVVYGGQPDHQKKVVLVRKKSLFSCFIDNFFSIFYFFKYGTVCLASKISNRKIMNQQQKHFWIKLFWKNGQWQIIW